MRRIKINCEINPVFWAEDTLVVAVSERVAGAGQRLSLGTEHAQGLTSEERPNGKANTVITKALLQGAARSENSVRLCLRCHVQDVMFGTFSDTQSKRLENQDGKSVQGFVGINAY